MNGAEQCPEDAPEKVGAPKAPAFRSVEAKPDSEKVKAQYARSNAEMIARSEAKAAELERMKANDRARSESQEIKIFGRFLVLKPVVAGSSACAYFDVETGFKLAITLEGVKRMGPEVVKKIVSRA